MRVFFDSSAFAKRYVAEPGSDTVLAWCERASVVTLAAIALPEIVSAFCRLRSEGKISEAQYRQIKTLLLVDIEDAAICDLTAVVIARAIASLERGNLRAMDAIHVGSALALGTDVFVSSDRRQLDAAAAAGLRIEAV